MANLIEKIYEWLYYLVDNALTETHNGTKLQYYFA